MTRLKDSSQDEEKVSSSAPSFRPRRSRDMDSVEGLPYGIGMASRAVGDRPNSFPLNHAKEDALISPKNAMDWENFNFERSQSSSFKKQARISKGKLTYRALYLYYGSRPE